MQKKFFFVCCKDSACCREWRSQKIKSFLENLSLNSKHQFFLSNDVATTKHFFIDHNQTTTSMVMINSQFCPSFLFKSKTEKTRHLGLFHRCQKKVMLNSDINVLYVGKPMQVWLLSIDTRKKKTTPNEKLVYHRSPLRSQRKPAKVWDLQLRRVKPNNQPSMTCFLGKINKRWWGSC